MYLVSYMTVEKLILSVKFGFNFIKLDLLMVTRSPIHFTVGILWYVSSAKSQVGFLIEDTPVHILANVKK